MATGEVCSYERCTAYPPYYKRGYADRMMHKTEHMWCRWCGGFGMTNQMVCGDSECLTRDMTDGVLSGLEVSGRSAQTVQDIRVQATAHYGEMMSALDENSFVKITAT